MADLINLRRARKQKAREEAQTVAEANRAKHGTPKRQRDQVAAENRRASRAADAHRLEDK